MPLPISPRLLACALGLLLLPSLARAQAPDAPLALPDVAAPDSANVPLDDQQAPPASAPQPLDEQVPDPGTPGEPQVLEPGSLRAIAARLKKPLPLAGGRVVILKSQRVLQLFDGPKLLKSYSVSLGPSPRGRKQKRGDGRTPEGEFYVCTRNDRTSAFHIFLGLSYPALPDAIRGSKRKLITPRESQLIRSRLASRSAPPWNTRLGGWVGIHGGGDAPFDERVKSKRGSLDWTAGCIAVKDAELEEISAALKVGARVSIRP